MPLRVASLAGGCVLVCTLALAETTSDGVFTQEQADRGQLVYESACLSCHDREFYETKLLVWDAATVGELFMAMSATMPTENPGGLSDGEYLDVLAYIFLITGSPAGGDELSFATADAIEIVFPAAP